MIRALKGTLAVLALAGVGLLLRWVTAGSISSARTYDLDSLTVLAVGTVAWIAYVWLVLAVVTTVLEQIPGVVGELAGAVAGRITTKTARALLRSGLGVAAVTPLTVTAAQATPTHVLQWNQTAPASTVHLTDSDWRTTEPRSTLQLGPTTPASTANTWRTTEPASDLHIGGPDAHTTHVGQRPTKSQQSSTDSQQDFTSSQPESTDAWRATEPVSRLQIGGGDAQTAHAGQLHAAESRQGSASSQRESGDGRRGSSDVWRAAEPASGLRIGGEQGAEGSGRPAGGGWVRVGVPDRPVDGAATRYTEVRAGGAVRVVVQEGDSLWALAARELGPGASNEAIAARWPEWYAANRQVIGDDPDLILPGLVLRVPPKSTGHLPPTHQEP
ncbi:hypothetical protein [Kribbella sp. NPDC000426]|uniref:LysM peptidoglycan-binding domain-containing protein n=1 Tax=Kribbella sp. NPDC000426 TaxID=3154255 RepID=UPI00331F0A3C